MGSVESLVLPSTLMWVREFTAEQRAISQIKPGTVRLSIGIEDADDLIEDLEQALGRAFV